MSPSGRIRHFLLNWEKLTSNKSILNMVNGLELNFLPEPVQYKVPKSMNMLKEEKMLIEQEIQGLLRKGQ